MKWVLRRLGLAAFCIGLAAACQSDQQRLAEYLGRAAQFAEEEKYAEAIISYQSALQIDPNNATAHYGLAEAYIETRRPSEAYWALHETVRLDPSNRDARLTYTQLLLLARQNESALEQARALVEGDPNDASGHMLLGQALTRLHHQDEARETLERAIELAPDAAEPLVLMAVFLSTTGQREQAEPYLRKRIELEPSVDAVGGLAGFLAQDPDRARDAEAEEFYREALAIAEPDERSMAVRVLASFYYSRERFAESEAVLLGEIERSEEPLDLIYLLARLYNAQGEPQKADALLEDATRTRPDSAEAHLVQSRYRQRRGDLAGALESVDAGLRAEPDSVRARLRKSELLVDIGYRERDGLRIARGRSIVDAVLAREPENPDALFVRAKIDIAESKPADAVDAMRKAVDVRPEWARGRFMLGSALFLSGDRTGARAELARVLELDAAFLEARKLLAKVHASLGEHDFAVEEGRRVLKETPDDYALRILLAQSLMALRQTDEAQEMVEAIPPGEQNAEAHYALGRIYASRGDLERSREHLLAANEARPNHPDILRSLLNIDLFDQRQEESYERIREAEKAEPGNARIIHLRGLAALTLGRGGEAEASFRRAIQVDPNDLQSYASLGRYLSLRGRHEETLKTYADAVKQRPDLAPLRLILGVLLETMGRLEEAVEAYEQVVQLDPNLATAKNNLAYIFAESEANLDRALDLAQEAKALLPDDPRAADTLGWVLHKKGIHSAAIGYLKEAEGHFRDGDPSLGVVRHHLALAYEADGDPDRARQALERAIDDLKAANLGRVEEPGEPAAEPAWATDVRAMLDRLNSASPAAEG